MKRQTTRIRNEVVYNTASILPRVNFMLIMHVFLMAYTMHWVTNDKFLTQNLGLRQSRHNYQDGVGMLRRRSHYRLLKI